MKFNRERLSSVSIVLIAVLVCMLWSIPVNAFVRTASSGQRSGGATSTCYETVAEEFGRGDWESFEQATAAYGWEKYYTLSSPIYHNGYCYQYYYVFSDGSRMYFGVL